MKLTEHFTLEELVASDIAKKHNLDNNPSESVIHNITRLAKLLESVRALFNKPIRVNSAYRSPEVNAAIGGSATSAHCKGFAADFEVLGMDNKELALWIRDNLKFTQLILEFYKEGIPDSGWVHCAFDRNDLKEQVLTATKVDGKTKYLVGIQ